MARFTSLLRHAWNAFTEQDPEKSLHAYGSGATFGGRPDRVRINFVNERSIIGSIYTRISIDVADNKIIHVRLDKSGRYKEDVESGLNECLMVQPNLDQGPRHFRQDVVMTMLDKGTAAIVPVDTTINPELSGGWDVNSLRVGYVVAWFPEDVRVNVYNQKTALREEVTLPKKMVAIIENPLYTVMNEPNSTQQRLIRKLNLLDIIDENYASGRLDVIIQLPWVIKNETKQAQAKARIKDIEMQLSGSKYGIAYADASEKITQLNRPAENSLMGQIEWLINTLYAQLGLTPEVMNGTADEATMLNYNHRTISPIMDAITEAMHRTFLTKTARTQQQAIQYFRDPFKLVPISQIAEIADKLSRNEIVSPNEIRPWIGLKPSTDPKADELKNSNMPVPSGPAPTATEKPEGDSQNGSS